MPISYHRRMTLRRRSKLMIDSPGECVGHCCGKSVAVLCGVASIISVTAQLIILETGWARSTKCERHLSCSISGHGWARKVLLRQLVWTRSERFSRSQLFTLLFSSVALFISGACRSIVGMMCNGCWFEPTQTFSHPKSGPFILSNICSNTPVIRVRRRTCNPKSVNGLTQIGYRCFDSSSS